MQLLGLFKENDIFPKSKHLDSEVFFEDRLTGKAIVIDNEKKIALVGNSINYLFTLPGGGVEKNESIEEGVIRECREEIGCEVSILSEVGIIEDYRNRDKKHCISYCYIAKIIGRKNQPRFTKEEIKNGMFVKWMNLEYAIEILEKELGQVKKGEINFYNTAFNIARDYFFLIEAKKIIEKNEHSNISFY